MAVNQVAVELKYDGAWQDITPDVRYDPAIVMDWGRDGEAAKGSPSSMTLTLDNTSGKYSPRHPGSALFGKIGRNTPIRVLLGQSSTRMTLPGDEDNFADTPDNAAIDITGDIDIRIDLHPNGWRSSIGMGLARKYVFSDFNRSWAFWVRSDGTLRFRWSTNGAAATEVTATSTVAVPDDDARRAVRVTLDVNNGSSQNVATFWTAPTLAGPWTQLGTTVTQAGVTSIHNSPTVLEVGRLTADGAAGIGVRPITGEVYGFELRNGIGGSVIAEFDPDSRDAGDTTWTDVPGRVWTVHGQALTDPAVRFAGEVASWPTRWDLAGKDIRVPIEAAGVRRRLGQGASALRSSLYRGMTSTNVTTPVGYWPMEDGKDATSLASAFPGHAPIEILPDVQLAAYSDAPASDAIPTITTGRFVGRVNPYTASDYARMMIFVAVPETISAEATLLEFTTSGSARRWRLRIRTDGTLRMEAFDTADVSLANVIQGFALLGKRGLLWLLLTQPGAGNITAQTGFQREGDTSFGSASEVLGGNTKGSIENFLIGGFGSEDLNGLAAGHAVIMNTNEFWNIAPFARGWSGETAVERIRRLCDEEQVPLRVISADNATQSGSEAQLVGPQRVATFLDLVDDAAAVDQGILVDDRDAVRLLYRAGSTLYSQSPALTLDYPTGDVAGTLEPIDDDQLTRNDITVERTDGSSARAEQLTGPLSVLAPPNGVGRYDESVELNAFTDGQLPDIAAWRLHLGTVDEPRYPKLVADLTAVPGLTSAATGVEAGDRVQITNPPAWLPPDTIDQLAQGGRETLTPHRHIIEWNTTPASSWSVGRYDDAGSHYDTAGSETAGAFTSGTSTSMSVAITHGPLWTTAGADLPFRILVAGVILNVTAISGGSSPQAFTVDRVPVNGVNKVIPIGSDVQLATPARFAL